MFYYLLIALVALVTADGVITRFLIANNLATESNPFLRFWSRSDALIFIKLIGAILAAAILWIVYQRKPKLSIIVTAFFVLFYTGVITWNLYAYFISRDSLTSCLPHLFPFVY